MHVVKGLSLKLMSLLVLVLLGVAVGAADDSVNIPVVELEEALRGSRAWSLRTGFLADDLPVVAATSVIATHRFPGAPLQSIHNLVDNVAAEALQTAAVKSAASSPEGRASLAAVQAALNQRSRTGPSGVSHSLSSLYFLVQELLTRRLGLPVQEWPKSTLYRSVYVLGCCATLVYCCNLMMCYRTAESHVSLHHPLGPMSLVCPH